MNTCVSYIAGEICKSGFPFSLSSACTGSVCHCCGKHNEVLPPCQNEDLSSPWLDETGFPVWLKTKGNNHGMD